MSGDLTDLQSEFSLAYVQAVASAAGYFVQVAGRGFDKDGIDVTIMSRGPHGVTRSPKLDVQVKSHGGPPVTTDPFPEDLKIKSYEDLIDATYQVPRILVVVLVPDDVADWLAHSEDQLVLKRCGYWHSLRGMPATQNTGTVRVKIPRKQLFDVNGLQSLMAVVASGAAP